MLLSPLKVDRVEAQLASANGTTPRPESFNASEIALLSGEEFVDAKDVPIVLFDGLSNENNSSHQTSSLRTFSEPLAPAGPLQAANGTQPAAGEGEEASELDHGDHDDRADHEDSATIEAAGAGAAFEPPQNISQYMDYTEKLFHDLRHQLSDLFEPHLPQLIRTSQLAELSGACSYDMLRLALALRQFEPWALRMIDSSGKLPEGIFEGSFTALGSYDECLNTVFQSRASSHTSGLATTTTAAAATTSPSGQPAQVLADSKQAPSPTQGKYCLVSLSPFMPPKPPADTVERLFQEEANRRNYTRGDEQFARLSPMFYYMKFRIGVCLPSTCQQLDLDSISSALSSSLRLNITIPDCRVKQPGAPLTAGQLAGGLVFGSVLAMVLCATLCDWLESKWRQMKRQESCLRSQLASGQFAQPKGRPALSDQFKAVGMQVRARANDQEAAGEELEEAAADEFNGGSNFERRLSDHWSWMSFSLLTSFKLHFKRRKLGGGGGGGGGALKRPVHEAGAPGHISCLNGIRVFSLCWVIVANSYLTLDPRATKRLSKTREAPRDFLFQLVVQASLAIETFFFLSGLLMSLSFAKRLGPAQAGAVAAADGPIATERTGGARPPPPCTVGSWARFYVHRYVRMTPPTMLVIAFSMYAYHLGDGPLWFEATQRVHKSCAQNWWRHLLHVANFIDTRQMCFIHYWYIAADMQLFLLAPLLMLLLYKQPRLAYALVGLLGAASMALVFYITYERNLAPTLLFYNTDPESRREFGNTIMTKPFTHALPYLVGMLVGWRLLNSSPTSGRHPGACLEGARTNAGGGGALSPLASLAGLGVACIALVELFLPYKWNNSHLPSKLMASLYAALFRLGWSLVLAFVVMSCRHEQARGCHPSWALGPKAKGSGAGSTRGRARELCFCPSGGSYMNRLLSLNIFAHLSKLAFVAYLIHLPLMSVFIGQTRGLFAFSHTLVIHFAISYLVMTFTLSFILVHIIEFPFLTFERLLADRLLVEERAPHRTGTSRHGSPPAAACEADFEKFKIALASNAMTSFTTSQGPGHTTASNGAASYSHQRGTTRLDPGDMCERL